MHCNLRQPNRTLLDLVNMVEHRDDENTKSDDSFGTAEGQGPSTGKKLAQNHHICKSVHTTGSNSETAGEKKGACTATKTEKSSWRDQPNNCPGQNCNQKTDATVGDTSLKCWYTNACSLVNKMSELRSRVQNESYDIIGISETWANGFINNAEMNIDGYSMYRKDRKGCKGGGLILYTSNRVRASINEELSNSEVEESLWCNVELDHHRLLVGLCYRCPKSTLENDNKLLQVMEAAVLSTTSDHVLIMGDFNYPEINYVDETVTASVNDPSTVFFNKTQELCLFQHVTEATRVRQHQIPSTLDYVFTDQENLIEVITYEPPLAKSDHVVFHWNLLLAVQDIKSTQMKCNYHRGNFEDIQSA